jgi:hypothetical protein
MSPDLPRIVPSLDSITCPWCGQRPFHVTAGKAWLIHTADRATGAPCPGESLMEGTRYLVVPQMGDEPQ